MIPSGAEEIPRHNPQVASWDVWTPLDVTKQSLTLHIGHVEKIKPRSIIHLDMDCFYAAIEVRDRPSLRGKPVAVGGARDRRGVLTTCNYEARKFGVRSAMPTFMALQRCPDLIVLPTRFDVYRREAAVIRGILYRFSSLIEPLSLDEAYLDVSAHPGAPGPLAQVIRGTIFRETKLTSSAGIGPNKLIAKIASEMNKPDGQFEVKPEEVPGFHARFAGSQDLGNR